jgi:hypothetical protein
MRKTRVSKADLQLVFRPFKPGYIKKLCRSYGVTILVASMITIFFGQKSAAQSFDFCTNCAGSTGNCAIPSIAANPDVTAVCPNIDIVFVLDESGSIQGFETDVENGAMAFINALTGTGVNIAVIEFNELARRVTDYTVANSSFATSMQGYFDGTPFNGQTYSPTSGTNWQDAMDEALSLTPADLILFFTDGNPTGWTNNGNVDYCGNGSTTQQPEIVNPMLIANYVKSSEAAHMFMLGVGSVVELNLQRMSGTDNWTTGETIMAADYALETSFSNLAAGLRSYAMQLCGTTISVTKTPNPSSICAGGTTSYTLTVTNTGTANPALSLVLRDTFPNALTSVTCTSNCSNVCIAGACSPGQPSNVLVWTIGTLNVGSSTSIIVQGTANSTGTINNRARVTGSNVDPVMGTSVLTVVADPTVNVTFDDNSICIGGTTTFTATVSGGTGTNAYQWQFNNAGTWTNVGTNSNVYTTPPLNTIGTFQYRVIVTQASGCLVQSSNQTVTTVADPTISVTFDDNSICSGGVTNFTATVSGGTGSTTNYQWQFNNAGTWTNVGSNQNTYQTPTLTTGR